MTPHYYAMLAGGVVVAITQTAGPIDSPDAVEIDSLDLDLLGATYADGVFTGGA